MCSSLLPTALARQRRASAVGLTLTPNSFVFSPQPDGSTWQAPDSLTRSYRRLVTRLEIRTTLHILRHYSATELIAAGVDVRTVAGQLGRSDGGTPLAYYTAWVREADQRASGILAHRLPTPHTLPARPINPVSACTVRPPSPYQTIAAEQRTAIANGTLLPGTVLPSVKQLATAHHVAHRALTLLAHQHLIDITRGRRATVSEPDPCLRS